LKIRLTKLAEKDLHSVEAYIRQENPPVAVRTVLRILEAVEGLLAYPNLGRPGRVPGTRELVVSGTPYIAAYRVRENAIWILRVIHAARRWPDEL
jgi:addiction module RelE/StbE family toxin